MCCDTLAYPEAGHLQTNFPDNTNDHVSDAFAFPRGSFRGRSWIVIQVEPEFGIEAATFAIALDPGHLGSMLGSPVLSHNQDLIRLWHRVLKLANFELFRR